MLMKITNNIIARTVKQCMCHNVQKAQYEKTSHITSDIDKKSLNKINFIHRLITHIEHSLQHITLCTVCSAKYENIEPKISQA